MELQELYSLMDRFAASGLTRLEWRQGEDKVVLCRERGNAPAVPAPAAPAAAEPAAVSGGAEEGELVTAPLVGVFYAAPAPGEAPFAVPGQTVRKGETLCILEAMKMMSEVPAPADCVVTEVLASDGEPVGFGAPLFRIRKV